MMQKVERKTKIAGCYKVKHLIDNFKIRVKIVQQKSLLADLFENETDVGDNNFFEIEERTFGWQEKVFGPVEYKFYSDEKNCLTSFQKEYHQKITNEDAEFSRLYSYVDEDACFPEKDLLVKSKPFETKLSKRNQDALPAQRNLKPFADRYNKTVVDEFPKKDRIRTNHYLYKEQEVMHIVVDLSSKNEEFNIINEALLCTVTYDRVSKNLTVNPDFTSEEEPYGVDSNDMSYDYWIWHASEGQSEDNLQMQLAILERVL